MRCEGNLISDGSRRDGREKKNGIRVLRKQNIKVLVLDWRCGVKGKGEGASQG